MNNSNPFVPQGSLQDQKNKKRARVKIAIYSIFAINILLITPALMIQGCKREQPADTTGLPPAPDTTTNAPDTNTVPPALPAPTNSATGTNPMPQSQVAPAPQPEPAPVEQTPAPTASQEYVVARGDSFYSIAKKFSLKIKEIEAANPGVTPTKLKVGEKLQIPPAGASSAVSANPSMSADGAEETYVVKSGDSLTKIAKHFGVSIRSIRSANGMKTNMIKVGEKLKIPAKAAPAEAAPMQPAPAPAPASAPASAPTSATPNQ
jgi:LysM repeat protein